MKINITMQELKRRLNLPEDAELVIEDSPEPSPSDSSWLFGYNLIQKKRILDDWWSKTLNADFPTVRRIKDMRSVTGFGLRESKILVDKINDRVPVVELEDKLLSFTKYKGNVNEFWTKLKSL